MTVLFTQLKLLLQKLGLFPFARATYRKLHPAHRHDTFINKSFFSEIISSGDLCFDIGANVGQTTEALAAIGAVIVAVEPNPNCIPVLNYQFKKNPNITLIQKAMGASIGNAKLHFSGTDSTASIRDDWPFQNEETLEVELSTLDSLIEEFGQPKFIKVDVEGFELEVFKGLSQPIQLIYFEMHGREFNVALDILERLSAIGEIIGIKAVSGDNSFWLINEWIDYEQIVARLGNPPPQRANIVVKMKV